MSQRIGQSEGISDASPDPSKSSRAAWPRVGLVAGVVMLFGLPLVSAGRILWSEIESLRREEQAAADSAVVGYLNISPSISRAQKPDPWFRVEGESILIWSGWKEHEGHGWFRAHLGDFERQAMGDPLGRDVTHAIDEPAIENGDGPIWRRIPARAQVIGLALDGCSCAYPMTVLGKVLIVNDTIEEHPYLVHLDPFDRSATVSIFDARVDGRRITLGSSGLTIRGKHVLYDRGTESLWVDDGRALAAFTGEYKGKRLPLVARPAAVSWSDWSATHPQARLIVGSLDRQRPTPSE